MSIANCNFTPQSCKELINVRIAQEGSFERLDSLERWQENQNGHISRIDNKLDKFFWFWLSLLATSAGTLLVLILTQTGVLGHR
jgi:hypothetical protein